MIQAIEKLCSNSCQGSNVFAHFTIDFHQGHLSSNRDILYVFACSMLPSWCPMIFPRCLRTTPCRTAWHQAPTKAFEFLARSWKQGIFYQTENEKIHSLTFLFPGNQLTLLTVAKSALRLDTRVTVHATYILWEHCDWQIWNQNQLHSQHSLSNRQFPFGPNFLKLPWKPTASGSLADHHRFACSCKNSLKFSGPSRNSPLITRNVTRIDKPAMFTHMRKVCMTHSQRHANICVYSIHA